MQRTVALLWVLMLSACSLTQPPIAEAPSAPESVEMPEPPEQPPTTPEIGSVHPAAAQFLADARNWRKLDNDARAVASLERAIRIDPRHPRPWLELAQLRFDGGDITQAENLALKARSLAPRGSTWFDAAEALLQTIEGYPR